MIIDDQKINAVLEKTKQISDNDFDAIIAKAKQLKGINLEEAAALLSITGKEKLNQIFETAKFVKDEIYGNRLVLFAPLYISNLCGNECVYCAFRASNKNIVRRSLSQDEIEKETVELLKQGHKRVLMVAGESYPGEGLKYVFKAIESIYRARYNGHNIRRVNVNIAPLTNEQFKELANYKIGTYQLFQETYHRESYAKLHLGGMKKDYDFRLTGMDRALSSGIHDVGIGALLGLYEYKFETLAMLSHIKHLEDNFGVGPHTISVPRIEPAEGSALSENPPYQLTDEEFMKVVAVLRISVPYTGIILSTRESQQMRHKALELGISQISAGSRTDPGGYEDGNSTPQFSLGDHRSLEEVIDDITSSGYVPSFCTGCYRKGRVGADFMDLAKPGLIKQHCLPNALFTFAEYLHDFAGEKLKEKGFKLIQKNLNEIPNPKTKETAEKYIEEIKNGKRDIYL